MRLPDFEPGSRAFWWVVTLTIVSMYMPIGTFFGRMFLDVSVAELADPRLTILGYAWYLAPGLTSVGSFATVVLRLLDKPVIWLGCASALLAVLVVFAWPILFLTALAIVAVWHFWWVGVGVVVFVISLTLAIERVSRHVDQDGEGRPDR